MHTIKITPNLLFEYQCISGKFIRLPDRIEKNRFGSENRIKSNGNFSLPELECSGNYYFYHADVSTVTFVFRFMGSTSFQQLLPCTAHLLLKLVL